MNIATHILTNVYDDDEYEMRHSDTRSANDDLGDDDYGCAADYINNK